MSVKGDESLNVSEKEADLKVLIVSVDLRERDLILKTALVYS